VLFLPERQVGKAWEPSKMQKKGGIGYKSTFTFFFPYMKGLEGKKKHEIPFILIFKPLMYFSNCCELHGVLVSEWLFI